MDNMKKLEKLNDEILKLMGMIDEQEANIIETGEIFNKNANIALYGELMKYFKVQLENVNILLEEKDGFLIKKCLLEKGNEFLVEHGAQMLFMNIWRTFLRREDNNFRFELSFIDELIMQLNDHIKEQERRRRLFKNIFNCNYRFLPMNSVLQDELIPLIDAEKKEDVVFSINHFLDGEASEESFYIIETMMEVEGSENGPVFLSDYSVSEDEIEEQLTLAHKKMASDIKLLKEALKKEGIKFLTINE